MRFKAIVAALAVSLLPVCASHAAQQQPLTDQPPEAATLAQPAPTETDLANSRWETTRARRELESLRKEYDGWKAANSKVYEMKAASDKLNSDYEAIQKEVLTLKAENEKLSNRKNIYWFFAGAAVFLIAFLFGNAFGSSKKRGGAGGYRF